MLCLSDFDIRPKLVDHECGNDVIDDVKGIIISYLPLEYNPNKEYVDVPIYEILPSCRLRPVIHLYFPLQEAYLYENPCYFPYFTDPYPTNGKWPQWTKKQQTAFIEAGVEECRKTFIWAVIQNSYNRKNRRNLDMVMPFGVNHYLWHLKHGNLIEYMRTMLWDNLFDTESFANRNGTYYWALVEQSVPILITRMVEVMKEVLDNGEEYDFTIYQEHFYD